MDYRERTRSWTTYSTGPRSNDRRGFNRLTKGQALVGAIIGEVRASAGSIGTTELANGAVTQAKIASVTVDTTSLAAGAVTQAKVASLAIDTTSIAAAAVTDAKRSMGWSTLANIASSIGVATLGAVGGYLLDNTGSSKGVVITSTGLSDPTAGDSYRFNVNVLAGTTVGIYLQSTSATFDGTKKNLKFGEIDQFAIIEAVSATRWVVTSWSTGVSLETST